MSKRTVSLVAGGVFAASLFCAASPAYAWDHHFRVFARPHFRAHFFARPFVPRVRVFPRARFYYSYPVVGAYAYPYPYAYANSYYPYQYYAAPPACYPRAVYPY